MKRRAEIFALALILATALGVRLYFLTAGPNALSDEYEGFSKLHLMLQWADQPSHYPDVNFGPLHTVLLWLPYRLTGHVVFPGRLLTLLFGLLLFLPAYRLIGRHCGPVAALAGAWLLAWLYPLAAASVVTLAEVPFVFFTLLAIDLLDDFTADPAGKRPLLFGAALAATAAAACRFEGWPLLPLYAVYLGCGRRRREFWWFAAALAVFPLAHLVVSYRDHGDPLGFIKISAAVTAINAARVPLADRVWLLPKALTETIGWPGLVLGAAGASAALWRRKMILPLAALVVQFALLEKKSIDASLDPTLLRYTTLLGALLALFVGVLPAAGRWSTDRGRRLAVVAVFVLAGWAAWATQQNALRESHRLAQSFEVFELTARLRAELSPDDRVLLGDEYHPVIVVDSERSWRCFRRLVVTNEGHDVPPQISLADVAAWAPTAILLDRTEAKFQNALRIGDEPEINLGGRTYRRLWQIKRWSFFRVMEGGA
ncbi:MAG: hypothetical protein GX444_17165 [Myxococcales bacterium]|nr:hypothetical protein [Myxococcales bacterium]